MVNSVIDNDTCIVESEQNGMMNDGKPEKKNKRIILFDVLRGVLMLWVFIDHFLYNAYGLFYFSFTTNAGRALAAFARGYWYSAYRDIAHPIVLFLFFCLSGLVTAFSKNHLKRAVKTSVCAVGLFVVTYLADLIFKWGCTITIGVLYAFAVCDFVIFELEKLKTKPWIYLVLGVVLSVVGLLYCYKIDFLSDKLFFLVFDEAFFRSNVTADYFPVLPYLGYFFIGAFIGKTFYKDRKAKLPLNKTVEKILSPVSFIGRTSLFWYFASQVIFVAAIFAAITCGIL